MPKKLTQHDIRQRAVQTLYSFQVQREMSEDVIKNFRYYVGKIETVLERTPRFEVEYQDDRIVIRGFQKRFTSSLSKLVEIYDILGIDLDHSALYNAVAFVRDFGGYTKKMRDNEALELFNGVFANLNIVKFFSIDFEETPVSNKVLEYLRALPKEASPEQAFETFNNVFALVHENVREKYTVEFFKPVTLMTELKPELEKAEVKHQAQEKALLEKTEQYVLNYDNEDPLDIEAPAYFTSLIDGVLEHQETLENQISEHLAKNWSFERLTLIERVILSVGAFEIAYTETPDVVAVNEAIELSKDFSDVKSSRFVNGVLTNLIKK
ncbi:MULTISPECIES: transcription antitermination factor NusB [unclassified Lactococcus]|uniref:transcription antitermination factor NusB n=1 Tax=unclassified Lactococcus TaxID=2643510 RepID=UPI0011CC6115|nr:MULTISPECIES: transcription antitermination factor NusB [unclassified Lactococcus]MQW22442.1 transcription antitermination factor NusB [Lactococcus sp. dk101]TXK45471.1 transcription antitermination factor NusB [Lactococcus sp. dk310]TXK51804.1 transcription antitermination factor NusB [Lactococcus sp. dk322]